MSNLGTVCVRQRPGKGERCGRQGLFLLPQLKAITFDLLDGDALMSRRARADTVYGLAVACLTNFSMA